MNRLRDLLSRLGGWLIIAAYVAMSWVEDSRPPPRRSAPGGPP